MALGLHAPLLDRRDLSQAPLVPFLVAESCPQECLYEVFCQLHADYARTENQHIHVVMLDALMRRVAVMADGSADAGHLVGGNTRSNSAAANQHAALCSPIEHRLAYRFGEIRIVRW